MRIFFLIIPFFVFSQSTITANYIYSNDFFTEDNILSVNNESFVYRRLSSSIDFTKSESNDVDFLNWKPNKKDIVFYGNLLTDNLEVLAMFRGDRVIKVDQLPKFEWLLTGNSKTQDGVELFEATTTYRGSVVSAFFDPDIPVSLGPYKFRGLPGLIYEVTAVNKNSKHTWVLVNIKSSVIENMILDKDSKYERFSFKETVILSDADRRKESQIISSRTGPDLKITSFSFTRNGVEQIYEWETTDEKK